MLSENNLFYSPKLAIYLMNKASCGVCNQNIEVSGVAVSIWGKQNQNIIFCRYCLNNGKHKPLLINAKVSEFKDFSIVKHLPKDAHLVALIPASINLQNSTLSVFDSEQLLSELTEDKTRYSNRSGFLGLSLDDDSPVIKGLPLNDEDLEINKANTYKDIMEIQNSKSNFNIDDFLKDIKEAKPELEHLTKALTFDAVTLRELAIKEADYIRNTIQYAKLEEEEKLSLIISLNEGGA